ncbi:MAG: citrate (Si)-synthase [Cenarchaeum sp. SB0665_bin_23]|nr:citrate (Si)-synthase [Cenarchaeum sp. SB0667_bin_13]MXY37877.1 citrate (Si)-synthase [Cenarchaeum sp. SB0664_bin_35]MXY60956.1 citrate (Si)-synthase [Cenarchaeum sp. SB0665_bin_23]MXZ93346.1 citrate (Si)-synthase [Cenarchaeum sp. SB0666_bin_15]MYB46520.1 citrate (Si)-synthase [Cenarchaeum sp. SB0662_bin_33]MYC79748.1 citrate (Si)-synthase [Cenarchaeum sp. SB0661_bin_35]MYD59301.1 citrate (Si)-synthase [Cenarchaeum sp. SB0678_bin_8]MYG32385.1 citrate (Si)-synthase [Cenarchaeum sp. SB0677_
METKNIGLRGIKVADTRISDINGAQGKLIYRGYNIMDLTENSSYEETAYLLLHDSLPSMKELSVFRSMISEARFIPKQMQKNMGNWRKDADPMDMLQAFVAALAGYYDEEFSSKEASYERAINLIAKVPTIVASWQRIRNDMELIEPDPSLSHAANFLYMMSGEKPDKDVERIFDVCLILHAEHTFNASTFTARQVASTRAHMYSAASAAIGSLSGELHGGANYEVMKMLLDIGHVEKAGSWIKERVARNERVMGMGHAVYKTFDPRARVLKEMSRQLAAKTGQPWFAITEGVEEATIAEIKRKKSMDIYPNVDLYSASIYYMLDIPMDLNTPIFAISRVAGWAAHVIEEKFAEAAPKPALYRPKAVYVGKDCGPDGCEYKPINLRT